MSKQISQDLRALLSLAEKEALRQGSPAVEVTHVQIVLNGMSKTVAPPPAPPPSSLHASSAAALASLQSQFALYAALLPSGTEPAFTYKP